MQPQSISILWPVKVKVRTLDIAPLRESTPQKRSDTARVLNGSHSFTNCTCTPTSSFAIRMSHICLCLPSYSWYSFTDPRRDGRLSWYQIILLCDRDKGVVFIPQTMCNNRRVALIGYCNSCTYTVQLKWSHRTFCFLMMSSDSILDVSRN